MESAVEHARAQYLRARAEHKAFWPTADFATQYARLARYNNYLSHQWGDSLAAMYLPEGELVAPGRPPVVGPAAIAQFLNSFTNIKVDSSAMTADSVAQSDSGTVQWGRFFQKATPAGQAQITAQGHFVATWRMKDGHWMLRRLGTY